MEDLSGHFLISTPQMPDPRFQEQVIFLCAHNKEGAMGVVINKPNEEISMMEVLLGTNIPLPEGPLPPVYNGGPVEMEAGFILYSSDFEAGKSLKVTPNIYLSREAKLLEKISKGEGPKDYIFLLGYAGWGPGQLEAELMENSWLTVPGDINVLFNTPDDLKWKQAARRFGINISIFSDIVGNA
ncbi:YqgE/AlgH family protein [Desulfobulbus sp. US1]|nr:YqgE/AlgH family protein [Desulfobulbus sp. US4]MCW5209303.1 YqgE/AlgH family protein [Desulfobulbus sp. US1]WLE97106.1 MAG: YqgE/AlgH family protein [Candidatus Electrothrix communis]